MKNDTKYVVSSNKHGYILSFNFIYVYPLLSDVDINLGRENLSGSTADISANDIKQSIPAIAFIKSLSCVDYKIA